MRIPRWFMGGGCSRRNASLEQESDDGVWELIELSPPRPPPPQPLQEPLPPPPPPSESVALIRFRWAVVSVQAIARKRRYFAFLGAYLQLNKDSSPQRKRVALEWQATGRRLQDLRSKELFGHLVRRHGRLHHAIQPIQNL